MAEGRISHFVCPAEAKEKVKPRGWLKLVQIKHTRTHALMHTRTHALMHTGTLVHACECESTHTHRQTHIHTHTCTPTHSQAHRCTLERSHTGTHLYMRALTHSYINTKGDWVEHQHLSALLVQVGGRKLVLG